MICYEMFVNLENKPPLSSEEHAPFKHFKDHHNCVKFIVPLPKRPYAKRLREWSYQGYSPTLSVPFIPRGFYRIQEYVTDEYLNMVCAELHVVSETDVEKTP